MTKNPNPRELNCEIQIKSLIQGSATIEIWSVPGTHRYPKFFSCWYPVGIGTQFFIWSVAGTHRYSKFFQPRIFIA